MRLKKIVLTLSTFLLLTLHYSMAQLKYPATKKEEVTDNYHGIEVSDPYRWLEDDNSPATKDWVIKQNEVTNEFLSKIPFRNKVRDELKQMWNYTKYSTPFKEGDYYLLYKNDGLQNQSILYIQKGLNGKPEVFLDPNTMSNSGTVALGSVSLSKKQKYAAYAVSASGSDWQEIHLMDVATKKKLADKIMYSKFSGISWKGEEGFYYSGYDKPKVESAKYSAKTEYQKIFFHKIGTPQSQDKLIYEDKKNPLRYKGAFLTEDEKWLVMSISEGTDGSELHYWNLQDKSQSSFKVLSEGFQYNQDVIDNVNGRFLVYTNYNAANYCLMWVDPKAPNRDNWTFFVKPKENKLDAVTRVGNQVFCTYLVNATSQVDVYDLSGTFIRTISLPGLGTASGFSGTSKDSHTFYSFSTYQNPTQVFKYDLSNGESTPFFKQENQNSDMAKTIVEQLWFTSNDGTQVPMFIYYKADLDLTSGPHPVLMYGYGGFNISLTPSFSVPMSYFVQQGGIYVSVSLRGGSEFGEEWHKQGMLSNKQNVFDDFISAAEHLIAKKITTKEQLAIHGRSNGGLLVGACMTQRPDLFKVALPGVGVLDMLRYHKFTVGWGWAVEYGSSDKQEDIDYLLNYSPLHNVKKGILYPATMITTADHDDRVVPAHSFKFAATLQEKGAPETPLLIRIDTQAGHGAGKSTSKQIDEWTDMLSFTMYHLGMKK